MDLSDSHHEASLLEAQLAFEHWRANRASRRTGTPAHLKALAIDLLQRHPRSVVCKTLALNSTALKRWAEPEQAGGGEDFVTLPEPVAALEKVHPHELRIILPNGVQVHATHSYTATELLAAVNALGSHT